MIAVLILSFQGPSAALVFPLRDPSLMWFDELFNPRRVGDVVGAFERSFPLALIVAALTVVISVSAGFAFRRRFIGDTVIFYTAIASLIVPGPVLSIGVLVTFRYLGMPAAWYSSALGAHLSGRFRLASSSCSPCSADWTPPTRKQPTTSAPAAGRRCGRS